MGVPDSLIEELRDETWRRRKARRRKARRRKT